MTVLPLAAARTSHSHDCSMGQTKSRIVGSLCPSSGGGRDSRSSSNNDDQSLDGFGYSEDEDAESAAGCCRIGGGLRSGSGYSAAAAGDDVGLTETQMVVLRDRQTTGGGGGSGDAGRGAATRLVAIAPRVRVAHASVDSDCADSGVLFSREIQILRHQCGNHRVR